MGSKHNRKKSLQLGMPYGTACGRLRKCILFALVQETERDICFKCDEVIEKAEDLSIEHMVPWLDNSTSLFWDLGNIAFSHISCNRPDRPTGKQRKESPPGKSWCNACQNFKDVSEFSKSSTRWNGIRYACKDCERKRKKEQEQRRQEQKPPKKKACKECGETRADKLVLGRSFCRDCYNSHQRDIMAERRKNGK